MPVLTAGGVFINHAQHTAYPAEALDENHIPKELRDAPVILDMVPYVYRNGTESGMPVPDATEDGGASNPQDAIVADLNEQLASALDIAERDGTDESMERVKALLNLRRMMLCKALGECDEDCETVGCKNSVAFQLSEEKMKELLGEPAKEKEDEVAKEFVNPLGTFEVTDEIVAEFADSNAAEVLETSGDVCPDDGSEIAEATEVKRRGRPKKNDAE